MSYLKKLRKLRKNPQLFFIDMLYKRKLQIQKYIPSIIHKNGVSTYTIVSACYNVEPYIDKFFSSLVRQTLSFKNNIFCVMVDDGSTDRTADIIKKWQLKYPNNIKYLYKENGGQASARNLGIQHVTTPWVTFTDPDDFLDAHYFQVVDDFLSKQTMPISMIGTHLVLYYDGEKSVKYTHSLSFKFNRAEQIIDISKLDKEIQLSAASAFFKTETVYQHTLLFNEKVKPNFEDAHFIAYYLDKTPNSCVAYLKDALYFYRKRSDKSSTLDNSWSSEKNFYDVFVYGKLDILKKFYTKKYVQNTVLYDIFWHIKYLVDNPERVDFLKAQQKEQYLQLLDECFTYISTDTIHRFNLAGCWFYYKVGMLYCFKHEDVNSQIVYIEAYDPHKQEICLRYFTGEETLEEFLTDDQEIIPTHAKTLCHDFLGRRFCLERLFWLPLANVTGTFHCRINGKDARVTLARKQYKEIPVSSILQVFQSTVRVYSQNAPWLIFDRDTQADDNAEHLYRWIVQNHPERNVYFVLRKNSHDWKRLEKEGFRMLAYGSAEHEARLRECSKIISSHIDGYVVNYFGDNSTSDKQICWLQHGVIQNDLSRWLNIKKRIDLFVTETPAEYTSIAGDGTRYRLTDKEVRLLGFPRHDALLKEAARQKRQLLIMPTWRQNIMGMHISGNLRKKNPEFMQTEYARAWSSVLQSSRLRDALRKYHFNAVFFPHANIQPYLDDFKIPDYIHTMHHYDGTIQDVFRESTIMLTDYSSVAFEMAYLHKAVVYYQFDEDSFFGGNHTLQKGYFDYRLHGFGPVATDEYGVMNVLEELFSRDGQPSELYLERMQHTFTLRDGRNCERVYDAICDLDTPNPTGYINNDILYHGTILAMQKKAWAVAQRRSSILDTLRHDEESRFLRQLCGFRLTLEQGRLLSAVSQLDELHTQSTDHFMKKDVLDGEILLYIYNEHYIDALKLLDSRKDDDTLLIRAFCLEKVNSFELFPETVVGTIATAYIHHDWQNVLNMAPSIDDTTGNSLILIVLCCHAAVQVCNYEQEEHYRSQISSRFGRNFLWRLLAAQRSWHDGSNNAMQDVFANLRLAFPEGCLAMPDRWLHMYCQAALAAGEWEYLRQANEQLSERAWQNPTMLGIRKEYFCHKECWQEALAVFQRLHEQKILEDWLAYAICLKNAGRFEDAYTLLAEHIEPGNIKYWTTRAELAEFFGDSATTMLCWQKAAALDSSLLSSATQHLESARMMLLSRSLEAILSEKISHRH